MKQRQKETENKENWLKRNRELIQFLMVCLTFLMVIAVFFQAYQSAQQVKESKRAIDLQYTPQIAIEINSNRIPVILTENTYTKADYFNVYKSDLIRVQETSGKLSETSEVAIPINITFNNLGNVGTKLEQIRYDFSCDPKGEKDWQVDILKKRIILPQEELIYSNYLFLNFGEIPKSNKKCSLTFKFFFYNEFREEVEYYVKYNDHDNIIAEKERGSR